LLLLVVEEVVELGKQVLEEQEGIIETIVSQYRHHHYQLV
jgi:hypothetical protein